MSDKLTKEQVGYEAKATMCDDCDDCRHYQEGGTCSQVEGPISPEGWCSIYSPKNPFEILQGKAYTKQACTEEVDEESEEVAAISDQEVSAEEVSGEEEAEPSQPAEETIVQE